MQVLGASLVNKNPTKFCRDVLNQFSWQPGDPLVIEGIRHIEILNTLNRILAPQHVELIYIELSDNELKKRRSFSISTYAQGIDNHSTENEYDLLRGNANLVIDGSESVEKIYGKISAYLFNENN